MKEKLGKKVTFFRSLVNLVASNRLKSAVRSISCDKRILFRKKQKKKKLGSTKNGLCQKNAGRIS